MARNTNINAQIFPVWEQEVFLQDKTRPIPGFKAIAGRPGLGPEKVFSIVSDNYRLVSNQEALTMGMQIHGQLFPGASEASFEVFNVIAPATKSFCQIDIIDKHYTLNIWKQELYVPFIRIHNSYNKSHSLKFDIGFCRKLCDNGSIFEQNAIQLKFAHTKQAIKLEGIHKVDVSHLRKLENEFTLRTQRSAEVELPAKYFIPLAAKTLKRSFNIAETDPKKRMKMEEEMQNFKSIITQYSNRYIQKENLGETAYSFFNVITDYASNYKEVNANSKNGLQTACGMWINNLGKLISRPDFNWAKEIESFKYLMN